MSLKQAFPKEIPVTTREVVEAILPANSVCRLLGDKAAEIIDESALAAMYHETGRGGINPVLLCFVLVLQFLENLPDREAAEMSRLRLDWKYALRQELAWTGFHYSSLCNFRKRLYAHGGEYAVFEQVLAYVQASGFLKSKRQRTDATHVLAAVERLSRLELVWETLRLALGALINADAKWVCQSLPTSFVNFYSQKRRDYRLSKGQVEQAMVDAGRDGFWLLSQIEQKGQSSWQDLPEIITLARVLSEQFDQDDEDGGSGLQAKANIDAKGDVITSPHEPSVRYSRKGKETAWRGYKAQVTETVDGHFPVITDIGIHSAIEADSLALGKIQKRLARRGLLPEKQYVDQAYCNGNTLQDSEQKGLDLRGFIGSHSRKPVGFRLQDFDIDLDKRLARCPAGKAATTFNPSSQPDVAWHVRFGKQCQKCPFNSLCTTEKRGRSLEVSPYHQQLTKRRREQASAGFVKEMDARARIESTICELARKHGLRQSRYRGQNKVALQAAFTAAALNLKRLARCLAQQADSLAIQYLVNHST